MVIVGYEAVNGSVTKVSNEQIIAEPAEIEGGLRNTPWGIEYAAAREAFEQTAASIVDVDEAITRTSHIVMLFSVLLGIGDDQIASNVGNSEWRETVGYIRVMEIPGQRRRVETAVKYVHRRT